MSRSGLCRFTEPAGTICPVQPGHEQKPIPLQYGRPAAGEGLRPLGLGCLFAACHFTYVLVFLAAFAGTAVGRKTVMMWMLLVLVPLPFALKFLPAIALGRHGALLTLLAMPLSSLMYGAIFALVDHLRRRRRGHFKYARQAAWRLNRIGPRRSKKTNGP
jgi:hypothetical protein